MRNFVIEAILKLWWANELANSPYVTVWPPTLAGTPYNHSLGMIAGTLWGIMDDTPYQDGQIPGQELVAASNLTPQQESLRRVYEVATIIRSDAFWEWFSNQSESESIRKYPGLEGLRLSLRDLSDLRISRHKPVPDLSIWQIAEIVEWPESERTYYLKKNKIHRRILGRLQCTEGQFQLWINVLAANNSMLSALEVPVPIQEGGLEFWRNEIMYLGKIRRERALELAALARALLALVQEGIHASPKGKRIVDFYEGLPILGKRFLTWSSVDLQKELVNQIAFWEERAEEAYFREPIAV